MLSWILSLSALEAIFCMNGFFLTNFIDLLKVEGKQNLFLCEFLKYNFYFLHEYIMQQSLVNTLFEFNDWKKSKFSISNSPFFLLTGIPYGIKKMQTTASVNKENEICKIFINYNITDIIRKSFHSD